jgi:hypothetical protein
VPVQAVIESVRPKVVSHVGGSPLLRLVLGDSSEPVLDLTGEVTLVG